MQIQKTYPSEPKLIITRRMAFYLAILFVLIWIAFLYRSMVSSLILGALLAYILIPAAKFLNQKVRLHYKAAAWLVFLVFLTALVSTIRYAAPIVVRQISTLANDFQVIENELISLQPVLSNLLNINLPLEDIIGELEVELNQVLAPNRLFVVIRSATDNFVWIMVTLMTCFFLLQDHDKFISWLISLVPPSFQDDARNILEEIDLIWKSYFRGQLLLMVIIGVLSGLTGIFLGLANALIIGLLAGLLELIPSLGPTVATVIAGVTAWTRGSLSLDISNIWFVVIVCGAFILIQLLENTILVPQIMGRRLKLNPALVFISIISTLALFGMVAGLIVIPLIASIDLLISRSYERLVLATDGSPESKQPTP